MSDETALVSVTFEKPHPAELAVAWFMGLPEPMQAESVFRMISLGGEDGSVSRGVAKGFKVRVPLASPLRRAGFWSGMDATKLGGTFGLKGVS